MNSFDFKLDYFENFWLEIKKKNTCSACSGLMTIIGGGILLVKSSWSSSRLPDPLTDPFPFRALVLLVLVSKLVLSVLALTPLLSLVIELVDVVVSVAKSYKQHLIVFNQLNSILSIYFHLQFGLIFFSRLDHKTYDEFLEIS